MIDTRVIGLATALVASYDLGQKESSVFPKQVALLMLGVGVLMFVAPTAQDKSLPEPLPLLKPLELPDGRFLETPELTLANLDELWKEGDFTLAAGVGCRSLILQEHNVIWEGSQVRKIGIRNWIVSFEGDEVNQLLKHWPTFRQNDLFRLIRGDTNPWFQHVRTGATFKKGFAHRIGPMLCSCDD